jgi:hypothetical protein
MTLTIASFLLLAAGCLIGVVFTTMLFGCLVQYYEDRKNQQEEGQATISPSPQLYSKLPSKVSLRLPCRTSENNFCVWCLLLVCALGGARVNIYHYEGMLHKPC